MVSVKLAALVWSLNLVAQMIQMSRNAMQRLFSRLFSHLINQLLDPHSWTSWVVEGTKPSWAIAPHTVGIHTALDVFLRVPPAEHRSLQAPHRGSPRAAAATRSHHRLLHCLRHAPCCGGARAAHHPGTIHPPQVDLRAQGSPPPPCRPCCSLPQPIDRLQFWALLAGNVQL